MCSARVLVTRNYSCSCARGSPKRQEFLKKKGVFQVRGLAIDAFDAEHSWFACLVCDIIYVCITVLAGALHWRSEHRSPDVRKRWNHRLPEGNICPVPKLIVTYGVYLKFSFVMLCRPFFLKKRVYSILSSKGKEIVNHKFCSMHSRFYLCRSELWSYCKFRSSGWSSEWVSSLVQCWSSSDLGAVVYWCWL